MIKQWREIGETDWMYCETQSWFEYCKGSPEHDTREVEKLEGVYKGQFEVEERV
jgi:hypothetical protein